ncbi:MAG: Ig-like domain repeat protein, partial [Thermoguttaceae bacterium]
PGDITTVLGGPNSVDNESLNFPNYGYGLNGSVAYDQTDGILYIADGDDDRVLAYNPSNGDVTTIVGDGTAGYGGDNGPATQAELNAPSGLTVDAAGNLYIADTGNNVVREVNVSTSAVTVPGGASLMPGDITTIAGNYTAGVGYSGDGGPATAAQLNSPQELAVDSAGDVFITDTGNGLIREVYAGTGLITTVAGLGTSGLGDGGSAIDAQLSPVGLSIDSEGDLLIADAGNGRIREILSGEQVTVQGGTTTSISGPANPQAVYGQPLTFTATVAWNEPGSPPVAPNAAPTGMVEFFDQATGALLATVPLTAQSNTSSTASFTTSVLALGSDSITATYLGDANYGGSARSNPAAVTVNAMSASSLQTAIGTASNITLEINDNADLQNAISAINGMSESTVTITIDLAAGQYSDVNLSAPQGVTVDLVGTYGNVYPDGPFTTIVGNSPAVTVLSGNVILTNVALTTTTDAPTLLVSGGKVTLIGDDVQSTETSDTAQTVISETGGNVTLQDDTVQSSGVAQSAVSISGGTIDLGTPTDPGDNTLSVSAGELVQNTTGATLSASGNTYQVNGSVLPALNLSFTSVTTSAVSVPAGQSVTLTATVIANSGSAVPTRSVDFYDTTTDTDLGSVALNGQGVAKLVTSSLAMGSHAIVATYSGDGNFTPSFASLTQTVTAIPLTITVNNASKTYGSADPAFTVSYGGFANGVTPAGLSGTLVFTTNEPAGIAPVGSYSITASGLISTNYAITFVPGMLKVNPYAFTYAIGNDSQIYGTPANLATALGTTISTGVSGQNLDIAYSSSGDTTTANVGSYSITGSVTSGSGLASNYSVTLTNGALTVNKYAFSYTIGNDSQTYGTAVNLVTALGTTISTGVNGQNLDIAYASSGDTATATVGTYPITGTLSNGSGSLSNYSVTLTNGTLTVTTLVGSMYVLDPTAGGALSLSGNAEINTSGNVVVDSNSTSAILASGNATVTAASVQVVGGVSKSGNAKVTKTGAPSATGNPLAGLAAPTVPTYTGSPVTESLSGNTTATISQGSYSQINVSGNAKLTLNPGVYVVGTGGISVSGNASLSGSGVTYIIQGGGFTVSGNANLSGTNVLIDNTTSGSTSGSISLSGNGTLSLSAASTGPEAGVLIFQPTANAKALSFSGNAMAGLTGTVYAPKAELVLSGNANLNDTLVVDTFSISGNAVAQLAAASGGTAYTPAEIRTAYGINDLSLDGTGETIAIVDAYDDPQIYQALDTFDGQFGLTTSGPTLFQQYGPATSFLTVLNQNGQATSLPGTDPVGPGNDNWEVETALDVEWAHAIAPGAKIILVEANSQSLADLMAGAATAASQPGVSTVSMSWGFTEGQGVLAADEATYDSTLNVPGVTFVASTGDY